MNSSNFRFSLDLHSLHSQVTIPAFHGDTSITLYITLTDGGKPYTLAVGSLAKITIKRPTGTFLEDFCMIKDNLTIVYPFAQNEGTCAVEGINECDITVYAPNGGLVGSPRFAIMVAERVMRRDDIVIEDEDYKIAEAMARFEAERQTAEAGRVYAEAARAEAEAAREANTTQAVNGINALKASLEEMRDSGGLAGASATHYWNGTVLTIHSASGTSSADLKGERGEKGDTGLGFSISKTYESIAQMSAGFASDGVPINGFVLIDTGDVNDADNAKLYVKMESGYAYLTDLSGSHGIRGERGEPGPRGVPGEPGHTPARGIDYWTEEDISYIKAYIYEAVAKDACTAKLGAAKIGYMKLGLI